MPPTIVSAAPKIQGPVNGGECYFWRTTGCGFDENCKYNHIPEHKGIDKKPWQRNKFFIYIYIIKYIKNKTRKAYMNNYVNQNTLKSFI